MSRVLSPRPASPRASSTRCCSAGWTSRRRRTVRRGCATSSSTHGRRQPAARPGPGGERAGRPAAAQFEGPAGRELVAFGPYRLDVVRDGAVLPVVPEPVGRGGARRARWAGWATAAALPSRRAAPEPDRDGAGECTLQDWAYETDADDNGSRHLQPFARFAAPEWRWSCTTGPRQPRRGASPGPVITAGQRAGVHRRTSAAIVRVKGHEIGIQPRSWDRTRRTACCRRSWRTASPRATGPSRRSARPRLARLRRGPPGAARHRRLARPARPALVLQDRPSVQLRSRHRPRRRGDRVPARSGDEHRMHIAALLPGRLLQVFTDSRRVDRARRAADAPGPSRSSCRPGSAPGRAPPRPGRGRRRRPVHRRLGPRAARVSLRPRASRPTRPPTSRCCRAICWTIRSPSRFDRRRRWLLIVRGDGQLAAVAIDRNSNVVAWSLLALRRPVPGRCACTTGEPHFLVELGGRVLLERFDERAGDRPRDRPVEPDAGHRLDGSRPSRRADGRRPRCRGRLDRRHASWLGHRHAAGSRHRR